MIASPLDELDALRREVDRLDEAMIDLLIERMRVVQAIAAIKRAAADGRPAIRPAREAVILRRLVQRAGGRFPAGTLVRMWRELLAATTRAQAPLRVGVFVPSALPQLWDLARDHFGAATPIRRTESAAQALRLLEEGAIQLAVLPLPGEGASWWTGLLDGPGPSLRVVARLPFIAGGTPADEGAGGFVVGMIEPEPSGDDLSLLAIEAPAGPGRTPVAELLDRAGLEARQLAADATGGRGVLRHLIEVEGFVAADDPRLADLGAHGLRVAPLGGYARPLPAAG